MQTDVKKSVRKIHCPMMVSFVPGAKDDKDVFLQKWDIFDTLTEKAKDILTAEETAQVIRSICEKYRLSDLESENLSRIVRDIFFGKVKINNIKAELAAQIAKLPQNDLALIENIIVGRIINAVAKTDVSNAVTFEKIPISQALKKYPQVGEQAITSYPIKTKLFETPVKPSIKNWIMDYQQVLGAGRHDSIQRGNYIFQNENTKRLLQPDREKLSYILKALDEDAQVAIDLQTQELVFPKPETVEAPKRVASLEIMGAKEPAPRPYQQMPPQQTVAKPPVNRVNPYQPQSQQSGTTATPITSNPPSVFRNIPAPPITTPEKTPQEPIQNRINFSSPQKLPVERPSVAPVLKIEPRGMPVFGMNRIVPRGMMGGRENDSEQKDNKPADPVVKGNTVDLRG